MLFWIEVRFSRATQLHQLGSRVGISGIASWVCLKMGSPKIPLFIIKFLYWLSQLGDIHGYPLFWDYSETILRHTQVSMRSSVARCPVTIPLGPVGCPSRGTPLPVLTSTRVFWYGQSWCWMVVIGGQLLMDLRSKFPRLVSCWLKCPDYQTK